MDIHSQHENLLINNENFQIDFIDQFASAQFVEFEEKINNYRSLFQNLNILRMDIESKKRLYAKGIDVTYQKKLIEDIDSLNLELEEKTQLELEYNKVNKIHKIKDVISKVLLLFEGVENSIITALSSVTSKLSELEVYEPKITTLLNRVKQNTIDLDDILMELHSLNHTLTLDSSKLEFLEDRINAINSLEKRLNVFSVSEILEKRNLIQHEVTTLDNIVEEIKQLEIREQKITRELFEHAKELSFFRKKVASNLGGVLESDLLSLGINTPSVKLEILQLEELSTNGIDKVNLLFSSNKGYDLKPLISIGSGGEIARLMLCVKKQMFAMNHFSTIIFDEIDSGVSGEIGRKMGRILQEISLKGQVICITHLPQIASLGNYHYSVSKVDGVQFSNTSIENLKGERRIQEIARMLSGEEVNEEAIANAKKMLDI